MGGEESRKGGSTGARMLLLRAEGCLLCMALDVVEGVFPHPIEEGAEFSSVDVVDWAAVSGLGSASTPSTPGTLVVVRTETGPIGLRADACLGVRDVSFLATPPIPTRLLTKEGRPLCYLVLVDRQPHFLLEPQALVRAREPEGAGGNRSDGTSTGMPLSAAGGADS